jgi:hypothetical protein
MSSEEDRRTDKLIIALATDGALTVGQAARYAAPRSLLAGEHAQLVRVSREEYRPTARSRRVLVVPVVRLTPAGEARARELGAPPQALVTRKLAHALGLAELRAAVGVRPEELLRDDELLALWGLIGARGGGLPDGLARRGAELLALEYDHGSYKAEQVRAKRDLAAALADRVVWGTPSARRARWLRGHEVGDVQVVTVPLWPSS